MGPMAYDLENRQKTYSGVQYSYDGEGRRVKRINGAETTIYVYDAAGQLAAEYAVGESASASGTHYLMTDHLGSTRAVWDRAGLVSRRDYLPFGEEILGNATQGRRDLVDKYSASMSSLKFTGKERDSETGLDFFGARYFSGAQGRFTSPDEPFADQDPSDPQSWNLYSYVRNNPLRFTDPTGNACVSNGNGGWKDDDSGGQTCSQVDADNARGVRNTANPNNPAVQGNTVRDFAPFSPDVRGMFAGIVRNTETPVNVLGGVTVGFVGVATGAGAATAFLPARAAPAFIPQILNFATKQAARAAVNNMGLPAAQAAAAVSAIARATATSSIQILRQGQS